VRRDPGQKTKRRPLGGKGSHVSSSTPGVGGKESGGGRGLKGREML